MTQVSRTRRFPAVMLGMVAIALLTFVAFFAYGMIAGKGEIARQAVLAAIGTLIMGGLTLWGFRDDLWRKPKASSPKMRQPRKPPPVPESVIKALGTLPGGAILTARVSATVAELRPKQGGFITGEVQLELVGDEAIIATGCNVSSTPGPFFVYRDKLGRLHVFGFGDAKFAPLDRNTYCETATFHALADVVPVK